MSRKLASIQRVVSISPIPKADAIETACVLGWECIVKKAEGLKPGDLVVYIEIDSIVPPAPVFDFLAERKYRVRTVKLRGQISQGLALPLTYFPQLKNVSEGDDVTDVLGVQKYDPEAAAEAREAAEKLATQSWVKRFFMRFALFRWLSKKLTAEGQKTFPDFIPKTDETRLQSMPSVLTKHAGCTWHVTEKLDGQSATYFLHKSKFGVCSRNIYLRTESNSSWWHVARTYDIETKLRAYKKLTGRELCLQGEIVGPNIQANRYGLDEARLYIFNVWDIESQSYLSYYDAWTVCYGLGLTMVPNIASDGKLRSDVRAMVADAIGSSAITPEVKREGVVWRTTTNVLGNRPISFKVINPEFLLEYGDETNV